MIETLLSLSRPVLIIRSHGKRFLSSATVSPGGSIRGSVLAPGTLAFTDYHDWQAACKGAGERAVKAVTKRGNLIYLILPTT